MMKIICHKDNLVEAVNTVQKAVSSKSSIPALEGILIEADKSIKLTGNDLEISIEYIIDGDVRFPGKIVVNSKLFGEIVKKLPDDDVLIEVFENNNIKIECGHSKFDLRGISASTFPVVNDLISDSGLVIKQNILREMIRQTIFAIGTDENKKILTGSLIDLKESVLNIVSIDGYRMALRKEISDIKQNEFNMVVPGKTLSEILKILKTTEDLIEIVTLGNQIMFKIDNCKILSRLLEGKYLNYKNLLPNTFVTKIKMNTKEMLQSVERASLMAIEDRKYPIKLEIGDERMVITSNTETGQSREEVDILLEGNKIDICLNPKYLIDALRIIEDDRIVMQFASEVGPCTIKPLNGDSYSYMIAAVKT
jgi:DNA polymerase-3 subunit beta